MAGKNTITRSVAPNQVFPDIRQLLPSTATWNQGAMLMYDPANDVVNLLPSEASAASFLGIAQQDVVDGKVRSPYSTDNDAAIQNPQLTGPLFGVVALMIIETGAALAPGIEIYAKPSVDSERGVAVSGTKIIGTYQGATVASAAAGQEIEVLIGSRYPGDTLKF